ncbi:MAG: hypothetical protein ACOX6S_13230 [Clostridia bacterium]
MYKKILICCAIVLLFLAHGKAEAGVAPMERKGSYVNPVEEKAVSLISYKSHVRWYYSQPAVNITMILENQDSEKKASLLMGIPKLPYKTMEISKPSVLIDGENADVSTRKAKETKDDTEDPYLTWYTWPITIEQEEAIVVKCVYTIYPSLFADRSWAFKLPMELLEYWQGPVGEAVVSVETPYPYAFDPAPNPLPTRILTEGRMEWRYEKQENFPAVIISTKDSEDIAVQYLKKQNSAELKEIGDLYGKGLLTSLLEKAEAYIENGETSEGINEVKYVLARAYALLNRKQKTLDLYGEIESDPGFGENNAFFKDKIAYDQFHLLQQLEGEKAAEDFLLSITSSSPVFQAWIEGKSPADQSETPPPEPTEKPSKIEEEKESDKKLIKNVTIWGLTIPVEILFLLSLIFIVIVFISAILGIKNYVFNRKKRYRYYNRRRKWY